MAEQEQIVYLPISEIHPYENNPRNNENAVKDVATSIRKYGWKQPIVIDKEGVIVVGHTRYAAALELGLETVPCIVSDLSDEANREYRIVDNKTNEEAGWDFGKLEVEAADLDLGDFDFDLGLSQDGDSTSPNIDWDEVDELEESTYEEPEHKMLECPACHHIDRDIHFRKVGADEA